MNRFDSESDVLSDGAFQAESFRQRQAFDDLFAAFRSIQHERAAAIYLAGYRRGQEDKNKPDDPLRGRLDEPVEMRLTPEEIDAAYLASSQVVAERLGGME